MRRVWVFALIAVLAVSAIVAGSAGYLFLSGGEASSNVPETEIPEDVYTGPEDLNASDGNISSLGWLCGGGSTDAYENYSPRSYQDYEYELANNSREPAEERYVNVYETAEPPEWVPVEEFSFKNSSAPAYEFTRYPSTDPTKEHLDRAWSLYNKSFEAAKKEEYFNFEDSVAASSTSSYNKIPINDSSKYIKSIGHHYINLEYITTEGTINPHQPEFLVYYDDPQNENGKILAGYMYNRKIGTNKKGSQIAGPLTLWHSHDMDIAGYVEHLDYMIKQSEFSTEREFTEYYDLHFNNTDEYSEHLDETTSEMFHVWFIRHPEGPFATRMSIPKSYIKEAEKMSEEEFKNYTMGKYRKYFKASD